jgi:hypothetical protein
MLGGPIRFHDEILCAAKADWQAQNGSFILSLFRISAKLFLVPAFNKIAASEVKRTSGRTWLDSGGTLARRRVLAQWRGVDLGPLESARAIRARAVGDVLSGVMKDLKMDARRAEVEVVKVWNSLLDPNIVAHAQPAGLRKGTLFVTVDSSVWLSEIVRYRRKEILDRLQHSFGKNLIQRISFRVG